MTRQNTQSLTSQKLIILTTFWMLLVVAGVFWVTRSAVMQNNSLQYDSIAAARQK